MARPTSAVCLGEAMVMLQPDSGEEVAGATSLRSSVGGAEANVAGTLAALGVRTTWVSRLGADPFGDLVHADLTDRGVTVLAERDPRRPTGLYLKDRSRMHYHRSGSAASAMDGDLLDRPEVATALAGADLVHTSGITAGILGDSSWLLAALLEQRDRHGFTLSVDLNWRPTQWEDRDRRPLLDLLSAADVVLLGADEAQAALDVSDHEGLRDLLGPRPRLVLKSDSHEASEHDPDGSSAAVPALRVEVVERVGAGDGFAAGYLAGLLAGVRPTARLRQGHLTAAMALAARGDHAPPPPHEVVAELLACDEGAWAETSVGPAGVTSPATVRSAR